MKKELLTQPFPDHEIRHRPGPGGKSLSYVSGASITQRLNQAFDHQWSFDIIKSWDDGTTVFVQGELEAEGIKKVNIGTAESSKPDALKSATTDALKRCALLFGIGLHLYGLEKPNNNPVRDFPNPDQNMPTERQSVAYLNICKFKGTDPQELSLELTGKEIDHVNRKEMSHLISSAKAI